MKRLFTPVPYVVALLACSCLTSFSDKTPESSTGPSPSSHEEGAPKQPYYLTGDEDVWKNFPAKPALGSAVDQADLLITLWLQASRNEDQKSEAQRDKKYSIKLVTDVIDPDFETKYPNVFQVLTNADIDSYFINTMIKKANGRLRPYVQHPTLVIPLFEVSDFSYPSGHATGTELQARILASLFPKQEEALRKRARQIADSRVVAGVHYASDTEAGLALGDLLFTEVAAQRRFQEDMHAAVTKDHLPVEIQHE
ncbi:MAG: phosphatase PAP2 family protein [Verrucomicrobia bacterium]|nr:phosphatase PAP2 family protein [Verrucomicrobiota bacterium]